MKGHKQTEGDNLHMKGNKHIEKNHSLIPEINKWCYIIISISPLDKLNVFVIIY